jgi:hypothetical protein
VFHTHTSVENSVTPGPGVGSVKAELALGWVAEAGDHTRRLLVKYCALLVWVKILY